MDSKNRHLIVYLVLATASFLLAVIASSLPNWSHLNGGSIDLPYLISFGPWRICNKPLSADGSGTKHCSTLDSSYVKSSVVLAFDLFTLSDSQWSEVQAVRAMTVIGMLFGGACIVLAVLSMAMAQWRSMLENIAFRTQFLIAFLGFVSTCVWANFGERDGFQYGASYICFLVSWLLALAAGLAGVWGQGQGIPEIFTRFATPAVAIVLFALTIAATAVTDWGHGEASQVLADPIRYLADQTYGLWKFCSADAGAVNDNTACFKYSSDVYVPYTGSGTFNLARHVVFSSGELSKLKASQAMSILAVLASAAGLIGVMFGRFTNNLDHVLYRARMLCAGLTFVFSFMLMCIMAAFINGRNTPDYGPGFAVNCCVWTLALVWIVQHFRGNSATGSSSSGGGYAVTTGDGSTPYASV